MGIATIGNAAKILWCTCCLAVLAVTLWNQDAYPEDAGIFFVLTMMALTFPICIGVTLFSGAAILMSDIAELPNHWVVTLAGWAVFVIAGYVQWFILVPAMLDRTRPISVFGTRDSNES